MFEYINIVYWLIAIVFILAWARFATFVSTDVHENLVRENELMWRLVAMGVLTLIVFVFIIMPSFWLALPLNLLFAGGGVAWYWMTRVKHLGAKGHLFNTLVSGMKNTSKKVEESRVLGQVSLTYLTGNDSPVQLPKPDSPLAAGLPSADQIMVQSLARRAETVELVPAAGGGGAYDLKFFVDGTPYQQPALARNVAEPAIQAIKMFAGLIVEERRRPQEGKFKTRDATGVATTWTVRTSGTTAGERLSLSANDKSKYNLKLDQLGLAADQLTAIKALTSKNTGVVLVGTPRGAGRTTTMYAMLRQHDAFMNAVHTIETNPQAELEGVTAHKFDARASDVTYSKLLSSVLLKDPNIVMASQCPDAPSADAITRFAMEGKRVYVGLAAFDTMAALEQWLQFNSDKVAAIRGLEAVISQRLVRILCPTCKVPYQPDEATLRKLNMPVGRNLQSFRANTGPILDAKGNKIICPDCGGIGFKGRTAIFEVLIINDEIRKAVSSNANIQQIRTLARKTNMMLLVEHGIRKFAAGITAINEVLRVVAPEKGGANPSAASGVQPAQK